MSETNEEQMPLVACVTVGVFQENCYLYACPQTLEAVIIDPGDEAPRILQRIQRLSAKYGTKVDIRNGIGVVEVS